MKISLITNTGTVSSRELKLDEFSAIEILISSDASYHQVMRFAREIESGTDIYVPAWAVVRIKESIEE